MIPAVDMNNMENPANPPCMTRHNSILNQYNISNKNYNEILNWHLQKYHRADSHPNVTISHGQTCLPFECCVRGISRGDFSYNGHDVAWYQNYRPCAWSTTVTVFVRTEGNGPYNISVYY